MSRVCCCIEESIERAREIASSDKLARSETEGDVRPARDEQPAPVIVITGSIYVVGEAMRALGVSADGK